MSSRRKSQYSLNRQLKTRRIFHQAQEDPIEGLCYHWHTTAQHSKDENYNVSLWELWLKGKLKESPIHVKENDS
jgi:hypothetical protein